MKLRTYVFVFCATFLGTLALSSCLNDDNKIPPNCYDGVLNNDEYLTDCGGPNCPECNHCIDRIWQPALGETWVDCGGECAACVQCWNGVRDGDEVGIDCGGSCNRPCGDLCNDGLLNGTETEIDCGGNFCDACPTCTDLLMNGDEIGIDCGGPDCNPCSTDGSCINGLVDGDEFWLNCGGSTCPDCQDTLYWILGTGQTGAYSPSSAQTINNGSSLQVSGPGSDLGTFTFLITKPGAGWLSGQTFTCDGTNASTYAVAYSDGASNSYSSSMGMGTATVTIQRYVLSVPLNKEFFRIVINGTLYDTVAGTTSITLTNAVFQYTQ